MNFDGSAVAIEEVDATEELKSRQPRAPDLERENRAFRVLAARMAAPSAGLLDTLCEIAIELCGAGSAGVSLLDYEAGVFRWVALTGAYKPYLGGTAPREFSPCGTCLDRAAPVLYRQPARRYTSLAEAEPQIVEGLVLPFRARDVALGTVWIVSHEPQARRFDSEDVRVMSSLADFAAAAFSVLRAHEARATAEDERNQLLTELEDANRAKDEFLAMLGHELRNPLSPIATAVQLMKLRGDTTTLREQQVIERQVEHLTRLVDDLLDVSRIARGKIELRKQPVEIAEVVAKAVEMASPLFERRNHQLSIEVPRAGLRVDGDPVRLAQVLANLLSNSARYTAPGGHVRLVARRDAAEVVVSVEDTGIGISAEMLPRVFDLFVQAKRGQDRAQGGLGLGLTLVKNLVALHGGQVTARSDGIGKGSEFVVHLPAAEGVPPDAGEASYTQSSLPEATGQTRVLVVDDNADAADALAAVLRMKGHHVAVAHDPVTALRVAEGFEPAVAVLDIGLPVMDGYELAARLRATPRAASCRFIALTGYGQDHDRARSAAAGFHLHLVKPVDLKALLESIAAPVGGPTASAVPGEIAG